jgi:hypothetical protein
MEVLTGFCSGCSKIFFRLFFGPIGKLPHDRRLLEMKIFLLLIRRIKKMDAFKRRAGAGYRGTKKTQMDLSWKNVFQKQEDTCPDASKNRRLFHKKKINCA